MVEQDIKRFHKIIDRMQYPKNFEGVESELEDLCKAGNFGDERSFQRLEETSISCPFAGVYEYGFEISFSRCP